MPKVRAAFYQPVTDALIRRAFYQVFSDAATVRANWEQPITGTISLRAAVQQIFALPELVRAVVYQDFAVTADKLRQAFDQPFSLRDVEQLRVAVQQVFQLAGVPGEARQYTVTITIDGEAVPNPSKINLERDIDQYYIEAVVTPAIQDHFVRYQDQAQVVIAINGINYTLMVYHPSRNRKHGGGSYTVTCQSPSVLLGESYADPISGDFVGFASAIAGQVAPGFVIDWQVHDEYYQSGVLSVSDQYPIEIIRDLAATMKGVVQSDPDGITLHVVRRRKEQVDLLPDAIPDHTLSDVDDFSTVSDEPLRRKCYNKYTICDQTSSSDGLLSPEVTDISSTVKEVRGYQVPWDGFFTLTHSGGSWVIIEPQGTEEALHTETVEFVDGVGSTAHPIYDLGDWEWQATDLGEITSAEDGSLAAEIAGDSLLEITYQTKCLLWTVTDSKNEQLQLITEEIDNGDD